MSREKVPTSNTTSELSARRAACRSLDWDFSIPVVQAAGGLEKYASNGIYLANLQAFLLLYCAFLLGLVGIWHLLQKVSLPIDSKISYTGYSK
ncbi:hypothetical protein AVEN_204770-1 [Araneus ventricosus]|uniref:Uncharacterized protein n=1 Tax=Araneus ventricosus TaxID=182803 RepID=A0A4Y2FWH0_ARAVE|nr:hypothetical protein AVEN_204770-1 [Araneus ventricosus]